MAANGLGHLAPRPRCPHRRRRTARRAGGLCLGRRRQTAPHLRRRECLPPGRLQCLCEPDQRLHQRQRPHGEPHPCPITGGARTDRCVCGRAAAGPRTGDRHLSLRLDAGLRTVALDRRQAHAARGRGDGRSRWFQPAVLLVLPAVHRRRPERLDSPPSSSTFAEPHSPPGPWPRSRSEPWPASWPKRSSPQSSPPWSPTRDSRWPRVYSCASTTPRRSPAAA